MNIIEDEVIGELRYLTVEFDQTELVTGGMGVISQDAVKRYFMKKCPDLKVKKCGGLKLDSQRNIVTMRIGIVNNQPEKLKYPVYGGALKSIVEEETVAEKHFDPKDRPNFYDYCRCNEVEDQKLLNPGYDKLKRNFDTITETLDFATKYNKTLQKDYDELKKKYDELQHEKDIVGRLYDALVIAVGKDAQKFTDLLVENERLKVENSDLREALYDDVEFTSDDENEKEDSAELAEVKKTIAEDDFILAPRKEITQKEAEKQFEMTGADGSKIEGKKSENAGCGDRRKEITVADSGEEQSDA